MRLVPKNLIVLSQLLGIQEISLKDFEPDPGDEEMGIETVGTLCRRQNAILIPKEYAPARKNVIVLHEVLEDLVEPQMQGKNAETVHDTIQILDKLLWDFLVTNAPQLIPILKHFHNEQKRRS